MKMATAYISFCRGLAADTCSQLIAGCKTLAAETDAVTDPKTGQVTNKQKWDTIDLSITCGGGDLLSGFACYNELKGLPVTFITRNCGAVDSAAIMPFLLGAKRYASQSSAFFRYYGANATIPHIATDALDPILGPSKLCHPPGCSAGRGQWQRSAKKRSAIAVQNGCPAYRRGRRWSRA
jgi:hypothetical protein